MKDTSAPAVDPLDSVITTVRGQPIRMRDVFTLLKLRGIFRQSVYDLIARAVVLHHAAALGLALDEQQVQRRLEERRQIAGLGDPVRFQSFLAMNGVTWEQWMEQARHDLLTEALKDRLVGKEQILARFAAEQHLHETVSLARIVVADTATAETLKQMLKDGCDFATLAREHSLDRSTREMGGYVGAVRRGLLARPVEEAAFASAADAVIGPFGESGKATLYKVYKVNRSDLNESVASVIRDRLFGEWLRREVEIAPA